MKTVLVILFASFWFIGCNDNQKKTKPMNSPKYRSVYTETAESKFEILSREPKHVFVYRTIESTFKPAHIQLKEFDIREYFANITTTTEKWTSVEGQKRNIRVKIKAFDNPSETIIEINKDCDEIELENYLYTAVKYGCCGHVNHYEIFDYENKQIAEGDYKIVTGSIPNSDLKIYVGFTQETNDSSILGTLYYTTYHARKNANRFTIRIKSKLSNVRKCDIIWPGISLQTNKTIDKFADDENEYTLWSLEKIGDENLINNLSIKFNVECTEKQNFKFLHIPIINGKPFGKDDNIQEIELD